MPYVDIHVLQGTAGPVERKRMIQQVTDSLIEIGGEPMRERIWVRFIETAPRDREISSHPVPVSRSDGKQPFTPCGPDRRP